MRGGESVENAVIINELYQVLLRHNLTVGNAIAFLDDTKIAVQRASKLTDCQFEYTLQEGVKVLPHKEL